MQWLMSRAVFIKPAAKADDAVAKDMAAEPHAYPLSKKGHS